MKVITESIINGNRGGVFVTNLNNFTMSGNAIQYNRVNGLHISADTEKFNVQNNHFGANGGNNIEVTLGTPTRSRSIIDGCTIADAGDNGILVIDTSQIIISNNAFSDNTNRHIYVFDNAVGLRRMINVLDNSFSGVGIASIVMQDVSEIVVAGNANSNLSTNFIDINIGDKVIFSQNITNQSPGATGAACLFTNLIDFHCTNNTIYGMNTGQTAYSLVACAGNIVNHNIGSLDVLMD